jgi:tetratricopeptide (TPR) repeat protein
VTDSKARIFEPYLAGLRKFASELGKHNPALLTLHTFEQRLLENIRVALFYGDTETLKAERSAIIYELNALAYEKLYVSFNQLCDLDSFDSVSWLPHSTMPGDSASIDSQALRGWAQNSRIAANYSDSVKQFLFHVGRQEYEEVKHLYWQLVYFVGTRELWNDCRLLSTRLLRLSDREGDSRTKGLVLVTGRAWPLLSAGHLPQAKAVLSEALGCFHATGSSSDLVIFYEYMADVEEEGREIGQALSYYREAILRSSGIDADKLKLKMMFAEVKSEPTSSRSRLIALHLLRNEFRELKSYREAMVLIEIARSLYTLNSVEALETARLAYSLLNDEIMMPSRAAKARKVLNTIIKGRPCSK